MMVRKIFKTGNSLVVSLPKEMMQLIGLQEGSEISVIVDEGKGWIILEPAKPQVAGIDAEFAQQLNDFIEQYRPALEALAK
jgi:putative addiction module antidote